jgi:membrane protein
MAERPEPSKKDSPGLYERFVNFRRWLWEQWSQEAGLVYRTSVHGRKGARAILIQSLLFLREVVREFWGMQGTARAASLAYTTLLSLIPLVVAFSYAIQSWFSEILPDIRTEADRVLNIVMPYQSAEIAAHMNRFAERADAASAFGAIIFLLISFRLFMAVEATFNHIWHVEKWRGYRQRIRGFTMLLFWGPILIGLTVTTNAMLLRNPYMQYIVERTPVPRVIPFILLILAFTMLFWLVPATTVKMRSAIFGAVITATLFELVRWGFAAYAAQLFAGRLNMIYGTMGLLILFLIALELLWVVILLGVEISYVHQNLQGIIRASELQLEEKQEFDLFFAFRAMIEISRRFDQRDDAPSAYRLAEEMGATDNQMLGVLRKLERAELIKEIGGEWTGWLPGGDPDRIRVQEVIDAVEGGQRQIPLYHPDDPAQKHVAELFAHLERCTSEGLEDRSIGQMVRTLYGPRRPSRAGEGESEG